ncbi:hypothetical protein TNCV_3106381 [Trichonephila clavipes]|nr:hypothetical protein TNCV_3106381 [Trichonephila clavipes]
MGEIEPEKAKGKEINQLIQLFISPYCFYSNATQRRDYALEKLQVKERFLPFKSDNISTEDMPNPGCPLAGRNDENIAKTNREMSEERRKTIDQVFEKVNLPWSLVQ